MIATVRFFFSDSFRNQVVSDHHIYFLERKLDQEADPKAWRRIGQHLKTLGRSGFNDAFTESDLNQIYKSQNYDDSESLLEMLVRWREMNPRHQLGLLCDALKEAGLGPTVQELVSQVS